MEVREIRQIEKSTLIDVMCNKCGGSCRDYVFQGSTDHYNLNYAELTPHFGYGSVRYDLTDFEVHICEECYAAFEATFKIQPEKKDTLAWG